MSIVTRDLKPKDAAPAKMGGISQEDILRIMNTAMDEGADRAAQRAHAVADSLIRSTLADIERRFAAIEVPTPQIMAVEIDHEVRQLKTQAAPCLGDLILNAKLGLNSLLVGPAGCGKTFAAHQLAEALGLEFGHVCFTAGASETWLFGRQTPNGFIEGTFSRLYRMGGVFLGDEMDAADANMLLSLNTALANGSLFNPINGETSARHADFVFVGGANTVGKGGDAVYTGRSRLDGSTLDRFEKIAVDYSPDVEKQLNPDADLYKALKFARDKLKEQRSDEIISTRRMISAYKKVSAGEDPIKVFKSLTLGWPEELVMQCKLDQFVRTVKKSGGKLLDEELAAMGLIERAESPEVKVMPGESDSDRKIRENNVRIEELKKKLAGRS